jgi:hypothetical protein
LRDRFGLRRPARTLDKADDGRVQAGRAHR